MRAILTWHSIDESGSPISVDPGLWRRQLAWLAAGPARVTSLAELLEGPPDEPAVALTFDDGFANFATEALPELEAHRFPATVFVVSGHVGADNRWSGHSSTVVPRLPLMDWETLAGLPADLVTIGAHTRTHPHLDQVTDPARLEEELLGCRRDLEARLGHPPDTLAYPYGGLSPQVAALVRQHYRWGCTTDLRPLGRVEAPEQLPRIDVHYLRAPESLGRWGSTRMRGWLRLRRGGRQLRAALTGAAP